MANTYGVSITFCGHAAFRIRHGQHAFYIDPFLSPNPKCPAGEKTPQAVEAVFLTHGHMDHVSDAAAILRQYPARAVCMVELGQWLQTQGVPEAQIAAINFGGTFAAAGVKATLVPAVHTSSMTEKGVVIYTGAPGGFVFEFPSGLRLYHAGDTAAFGDMRLIAELHRPELAMLPIGDHYTMGPREAAYAAKLLGVKAVIPMHYGTFPALTGTPAEFRRHLDPGIEMVEMAPGQTL
jgi:L-ascorbate metabolism protein UlaG (beta-lactamase superfamily)